MSLLVPLMLLPVRLEGGAGVGVRPGSASVHPGGSPRTHLWPMLSGTVMISGASKNSLSSSSSLKSPFAEQQGSGGRQRQRGCVPAAPCGAVDGQSLGTAWNRRQRTAVAGCPAALLASALLLPHSSLPPPSQSQAVLRYLWQSHHCQQSRRAERWHHGTPSPGGCAAWPAAPASPPGGCADPARAAATSATSCCGSGPAAGNPGKPERR